ncbi:putative hydrophobic protein (TIGR00271 family) [Actinomycetospora succinea]|uniref:Putative hydrophobic protein (TIGR00271 family) n=1 Tax=Actinomycetospora succinea TaxID=663603 RepID=A0A4R6VAA5_9PSEU|nr:DUF389 domain-containing protein [Actinomycetospora succinea]TDQ58786.1 putative hydrophobic protein (TIGR00271 family) [Actinomycetospora succinea]
MTRALPFGPVTEDDLDRVTGKLFLTDRTGLSAFWVLLTLAAVIASTGVVADSTATVIGAMIVAPLMTPILGTALALVLADRRAMLASVALVVGGAVLVVGIGYLSGLLSPVPEVAATNSQVASRVAPKLVDLVSALATGAVGAFALVRSDVSDTLPGVAIAISLVPPLAVVGLTLESGAPDQAGGALLLFLTNVTAIIATGTVVLLAYRVRATAVSTGREVGRLRPRTVVVVVALLVAVAVPLGVGSYQTFRGQRILTAAQPVVAQWAQARSWQVVDVTWSQGVLQVVAAGPPPAADPASLRGALDGAGLTAVPARLSEVLGGTTELPVSPSP